MRAQHPTPGKITVARDCKPHHSRSSCFKKTSFICEASTQLPGRMTVCAKQMRLADGHLPFEGRRCKRTGHADRLQQLGADFIKSEIQPVSDTAVCTLKERHGRLVSIGAPGSLGFLNGEWHRCPEQPDIAGRPHYILRNPFYAGMLHMTYCWSALSWQLSSDLSASPAHIFATAKSDAQHPNTVEEASWRVLDVLGGLVSCGSFDVNCQGPNTPEEPFLIEELGNDFFVCAKPRKMVVWFECPRTGQTFHSGAKRSAGRKAGNRYCHLCNSCFSANNFSSQHLRKHSMRIAKKKSRPATSISISRMPFKLPAEDESQYGSRMLPPLFSCASAFSEDYSSEISYESLSTIDADDFIKSGMVLDEADLLLISTCC